MIDDVMRIYAKATRNQTIDPARTALDFKDLVAVLAMKVMMMMFATPLIAGHVSDELNSAQPLLAYQALDVAIDGGDAQAGHAFRGQCQHLLGAEGSIDLLKGLPHRVALPGILQKLRPPNPRSIWTAEIHD